MRDLVIFLAGWLGMWGVKSFEETAAKVASMIAALLIYSICIFVWEK